MISDHNITCSQEMEKAKQESKLILGLGDVMNPTMLPFRPGVEVARRTACTNYYVQPIHQFILPGMNRALVAAERAQAAGARLSV